MAAAAAAVARPTATAAATAAAAGATAAATATTGSYECHDGARKFYSFADGFGLDEPSWPSGLRQRASRR